MAARRLLLQQLVVLMCTSVVWSGPLCGVDEFFDGVVGACSLCRDVCNPDLPTNALAYCQNNCKEYYNRLLNVKTAQAGDRIPLSWSMTSSTPVSTIPDVEESLDDSNMTSLSTSWLANPLIWTTFVSLMVAVIATVVMVPLLVCIRRRSQLPSYVVVRESAKGSMPMSGCSSVVNSLPTTPTTLLLGGPDWHSDKSDKPLFVMMAPPSDSR